MKLPHSTLVELAISLHADWLNYVEAADLNPVPPLKLVAYSEGRNGRNGAIWQDEDCCLYYASKACPATQILTEEKLKCS